MNFTVSVSVTIPTATPGRLRGSGPSEALRALLRHSGTWVLVPVLLFPAAGPQPQPGIIIMPWGYCAANRAIQKVPDTPETSLSSFSSLPQGVRRTRQARSQPCALLTRHCALAASSAGGGFHQGDTRHSEASLFIPCMAHTHPLCCQTVTLKAYVTASVPVCLLHSAGPGFNPHWYAQSLINRVLF